MEESFWRSKTAWAAVVAGLVAGWAAYTEKIAWEVCVLIGLAAFQQAFFRQTTVKNTRKIERSNAVVADSVERLNETLPDAVAEGVKHGNGHAQPAAGGARPPEPTPFEREMQATLGEMVAELRTVRDAYLQVQARLAEDAPEPRRKRGERGE